jgi:nicotinamidase-related amidase
MGDFEVERFSNEPFSVSSAFDETRIEPSVDSSDSAFQSREPSRMPRRALIIIDLQNDYFPGGKWTLIGIEAAADNVARLLAAARDAGDLVVHIRHEFRSAEAPFFVPGSAGAQIHPKARNIEGEHVVLKHEINSFRETDLKEILDRNGVQEVVICGAMSHMCVDAATRAANDLGYTCTVVHDACATRDLEFGGVTIPAAQVHASFMSALQFGYATNVATEELLAKDVGATG